MCLRYALQFFNETHSRSLNMSSPWHNLCVDLPPQYGSLDTYRATLGHKGVCFVLAVSDPSPSFCSAAGPCPIVKRGQAKQALTG